MSAESESESVTRYLRALSAGNKDALDQLMPWFTTASVGLSLRFVPNGESPP
jgi:hypothetical protein